MIDLRNVPTSREKIALVGQLLSEAKNEFNAGRENFDNRTKQLWEAANEQYTADNAMRYNDKYRTLSTQSLIYDRLLQSLEDAHFPDSTARERTLAALRMQKDENASRLGYFSEMIKIGSKVRQTSFNPDAFVSLGDVVPDDYMFLAEKVSDCKDRRELSYNKLVAEKQKPIAPDMTMGDYLSAFQSGLDQAVAKTFGDKPFETFSYGTQLSPEFIKEIIAMGESLNSSVQSRESGM